MIHTEDLEEARLLGGEIVLRWKAPYEMAVAFMSAQAYHEMLRDFDNMISAVEQEFPPCSETHKLATAIRKRWFP